MGTRDRQEHYQIEVEYLNIVRSMEDDVTCIEWIEAPIETRQGGQKKTPRSVTQKLFIFGGPWCPVAAIVKYLSKHPESLTSTGPLYLSPLIDAYSLSWTIAMCKLQVKYWPYCTMHYLEIVI